MENKPILAIDNIGYRAGDATILSQVRFNLAPGEFRLITGPSGCGKSTLLKIIASLLSPTEGEVRFNGENIFSLSPEHYRQRVSYCVQTPALFGNTVYDNLIFPLAITPSAPVAGQAGCRSGTFSSGGRDADEIGE